MRNTKTTTICLDYSIATHPLVLEMVKNHRLSSFINDFLKNYIQQKVGNVKLEDLKQELVILNQKIEDLTQNKLVIENFIAQELQKQKEQDDEQTRAMYQAVKDNWRDMRK